MSDNFIANSIGTKNILYIELTPVSTGVSRDSCLPCYKFYSSTYILCDFYLIM